MGGEHEDWFRNHDPVLLYARRMISEGDANPEQLMEIDSRVRERMRSAVDDALAAAERMS